MIKIDLKLLIHLKYIHSKPFLSIYYENSTNQTENVTSVARYIRKSILKDFNSVEHSFNVRKVNGNAV